jgi:chromosome segregation ATPase
LEAQIKDAYAEVAAARGQIDGLKKALAECDTGMVDSTRSELAAAHDRVAELTAELDDAKSSASRTVAALRLELARAEGAVDTAMSELAAVRRAAARREEELAGEVAELATALSAAQRALDDRSQAARSEQAAAGDLDLDQHLRQQAAAAAEAAILSERRQAAMLRAEVESLQHQLAATRAIVESLQRDLAGARAERAAAAAEAFALSTAAKAASVAAPPAPSTEQISTLTDRLMRVQHELDATRAELNAARVGMQRERDAHAATKSALAALEADEEQHNNQPRSGDSDALGSVWGAKTPQRPSRDVGGAGVNARPRRVALTPITELRQLSRNRQVAAAADTIDAIFLGVGRMLFGSPVARLSFMGYLLLLHAWSLFILLFHTHSLPHDNHSPLTKRP